MESEKKPWIVILLEGQPSVKHVMGYVLAPDHIRSAVNQKIWRDYSKDGSEWKVHEEDLIKNPDMRRLKYRGINRLYEEIVKALSKTGGTR